MIERKFLFFKTRKAFEEQYNNIQKESIVFIKGETTADRAIWTHGVFFLPSTGLEHSKGFFESYLTLLTACLNPVAGDWAIVAIDDTGWVFGDVFPVIFGDYYGGDWVIYTCVNDGIWVKTDRTYDKEGIDLTEYLKRDEINLDLYFTKSEANSKQDKLTSGVNIKTINGKSILGSGNIDTTLDLSDYVKKSDLKTINFESLIGSGNIEIQSTTLDIDLTKYVSWDEYATRNDLLSLTAKPVNGKYTIDLIKDNNEVEIQWELKKGSTVVSPDSLLIDDGILTYDISANLKKYTLDIKNDMTFNKQKVISVIANANGEEVVAYISFYIAGPTFCGFCPSDPVGYINLENNNDFLRIIIAPNNISRSIENKTSGNYLYIATPLKLTEIAVDKNYTYPVAMTMIKQEQVEINIGTGTSKGLISWYKSKEPIDVCNLTYYMRFA